MALCGLALSELMASKLKDGFSILTFLTGSKMTSIRAKVIAHSITEDGREISTILTRSPLSYHPQNMTHRQFSRNAGSARAMPSTTVMMRVMDDPVYPIRWAENQPGMQGWKDLDPDTAAKCKALWDYHRDITLLVTKELNVLKLHKQYANRLLTPHQHIDVLWTTTGWKNFMRLRDHPDAQPEEQEFAKAIEDALSMSVPKLLKYGEWHLPWIRDEDWDLGKKYLGVGESNSPATLEDVLELLKDISASRCATLSYGNADGSPSTFEKDLARISKLKTDPLHASPFEHQATPDRKITVERIQHIPDPDTPGFFNQAISLGTREEWEHPELHGNLTGFIQYRKTIPGEFVEG